MAHLEATWRDEAGLDERRREHLLSVLGQARAEVRGTGVVQRMAVSSVLVLYRRSLEASGDALTAARVVAELTRSLRTLGLLKTLGWHGHGRTGDFNLPTRKRPVPTATPRRQEREDEDERAGTPAGTADEAAHGGE